MWKPFSATLNYLGGKRKLVPEIFKHIPTADKAPVFADAFLGGASVSLFAKARGHKVICNDLAMRSCIIGHALIKNQTQKITDEDILRLLTPIKNDGFVKANYCPKLFTTNVANFIDNALEQIKTFPEIKQDLLKLMLMRFIVSTRPFGHFSALRDSVLLENGDYERPFRTKTYAAQNMRQVKNPYFHLKKLQEQINKGIFDNGQENEVHHGDVFDFVKNIKADIIYFDPPYAETASYEETYNVLDNILNGKVKKPEVSEFTKRDALEFQDKLYQASRHIKDWVISMGQTDKATGITLEELLAVVRKYRPHAQGIELKHKWAINNGSKKTQKDNVEYLIFTTTQS